MEVILTKEVLGLGDPGQVVTVKKGYGRNYLIPQGMAVEATKKNMASIKAQSSRIVAAQTREAEALKSEAEKLEGVVLAVKVKSGEGGKLYGSVTNMDLAASLAQQGFEIDRRRILLEAPIKRLGDHPFKIKLHPQVVVDLTVKVESEDEEKPAKEQAEAAEAVAAEPEAAAAEDQAPAPKAEAKGKGKKAAEQAEEPEASAEAAEKTPAEE